MKPDQLLAQADVLFLLADMLRPPATARPRLASVQRDDPPDLLSACGLDDHAPLLAPLLAAWEASQTVVSDDWSDEYHRLFEGAMACPLNETAYIRRDKGAILGDLAGYYRAFGWSPADRLGEKPDHLVTELEFIAVLLAMRAQATGEAIEVTAEALASFVAGHLGDWIGAVCNQFQSCTRLLFYDRVVAALQAVWQALLAAHRWPITPPADFAFTPEPDTDPFCECGHPAGRT